MNEAASSHYTFGNSSLAGARLERLAAAYAPSSRTFLRQYLPAQVGRAVDLGSGLGLTAHLLHSLTRASVVVGYERSPEFVLQARARFPDLIFREVDVLETVYPDRDLDVIYSRFLLTHLHAPEQVLATCVGHLVPGGRLLLEETSELVSPLSTLRRYYTMVAELQAHYGQELAIGRRLADLARRLPQCRVSERQTQIHVPAPTMAKLHAMNIATWKRDPHMLATHGLDALNGLERELAAIAETPEPLPPVCSVMAQVVVEKTRGGSRASSEPGVR